jgi:hypothetical protein
MPACWRRRKPSSFTKFPATGYSRPGLEKLGMKDAVKLLDQTLAEEKKTDAALTKLADTAVNCST